MTETPLDTDKFTGIVIREVECTNVPSDWLHNTDPYLIFHMHGNYNYQTDVKFRNTKPHWENLNYVITFPKGHANEALWIEVKNRVTVNKQDRPICSVVIPQNEIQNAPKQRESSRELKVFVLERALEPSGNIKVSFVPLFHGDHPSPGSLPIMGIQWSNWGDNLHAMPACVFCPKTKEDMREIVKRAVQQKRRIRVSGDGHSWSPMTPTEDYLIDCRQMRRVINVDQMSGTATVECGCSVGDLDPVLTQNGLCLPTNVVLTSVRYGGVVATGCHGPGVKNPTISDFVKSMTIIGYDGKEVYEKTYSKDDGEMFSAVQVNLGSFGVIYSITFELPKLTNLTMADEVVPLEKAMSPSYLKMLHETNKYCEIFWWPYTKEVWVKTWNDTENPAVEIPLRDTWNDVTQSLSSDFGVFLLDLIEKIPKQTPAFCKTIWELAKGVVVSKSKVTLPMPKALHFQKYIDTVRCVDTEYCIEVDKEFKNMHDAWAVILEKINKFAGEGLYPINIVVEIRMHGRSTCMLSPSYSDDPDSHHAYIEFLSYYKTPSWESCSREISYAWMSNPNLKARPHWAKMFQTVPLNNLVPHLKKTYGPNWDKWAQLRNQADPTKMFLNDYVEQMFYGPLDPPTVDLTAPIKLNTTEIIEKHMKVIDTAHPLDNKVTLYNKEKLASVIKAEKEHHHHHHEHKDDGTGEKHHHHHEHKDGQKSPEHHHHHSKDSKGSRSPTPTSQATDPQSPKTESSHEKEHHHHHHKDSQSTTSSKKSRKPRSKSTNTEQKKEEKKKTLEPTEIAVEDEDKKSEGKAEQPPTTEPPKTTETKAKRQRSKSCIIS